MQYNPRRDNGHENADKSSHAARDSKALLCHGRHGPSGATIDTSLTIKLSPERLAPSLAGSGIRLVSGPLGFEPPASGAKPTRGRKRPMSQSLVLLSKF